MSTEVTATAQAQHSATPCRPDACPSDADTNHIDLTPTEAEIEDGSETWVCPHCSGLIRATESMMIERDRVMKILRRYWSKGLVRMIAGKVKSGV